MERINLKYVGIVKGKCVNKQINLESDEIKIIRQLLTNYKSRLRFLAKDKKIAYTKLLYLKKADRCNNLFLSLGEEAAEITACQKDVELIIEMSMDYLNILHNKEWREKIQVLLEKLIRESEYSKSCKRRKNKNEEDIGMDAFSFLMKKK